MQNTAAFRKQLFFFLFYGFSLFYCLFFLQLMRFLFVVSMAVSFLDTLKESALVSCFFCCICCICVLILIQLKRPLSVKIL